MCNWFKRTRELPSPKSRIPLSLITSIVNILEPQFPRLYPTEVSNTNSMEPLIDVGCRCIMAPVNPNDLQVGDVIIYDKDGIIVPFNRDRDDIIHAITKIGNDGSRFFKTKGFNNNREDKIKVRDNMVVSVLVGILYVKES